MTKARITLSAESVSDLKDVIGQIVELARTLNMKIRGPVPLPKKRYLLTTRRTPCGDGSDTYEHWEKRISKRLIDIEGDEKTIKQIMRIRVPTDVFVKISLN
ncbi:MAG: 30S ribosomal protein S10 [Candidatus Micrarchaeota archaeon]